MALAYHKTKEFANPQCDIARYPDWESQEERFWKLANGFIERLPYLGADTKVFVEGYAYAAHGRVFHIGEAMGFLKAALAARAHNPQISIVSIPPTEVKKFATGSGRASKGDMIEAFHEEKPNLAAAIKKATGKTGPLNDIADAYFVGATGIAGTPVASGV